MSCIVPDIICTLCPCRKYIMPHAALITPTSRDKINLKNPWRLFSPWRNRGPIEGLSRDPSWDQKVKKNEIKEILAQSWLL